MIGNQQTHKNPQRLSLSNPYKFHQTAKFKTSGRKKDSTKGKAATTRQSPK
jgi:hypothetical protein